VNAIILVILVPFFTAIGLALLRERPQLEKAVSLASGVGLTAYVFWLLHYVDTHGIQVSMIAGYSPPMASPSSPTGWRASCSACRCPSAPSSSPTAASRSRDSAAALLLPVLPRPVVGGELVLHHRRPLQSLRRVRGHAHRVVRVDDGRRVPPTGAADHDVRAINLVGGALFVVGIALVYALVGTLNMADLAERTAVLGGRGPPC